MAIRDRALKPGTVLVARYRGRQYRCEVVALEEGVRYRLEDGRRYRSLSAAGSAVTGGKACNGWRFWSLAGEAGPARAGRGRGRKRNPRGLPPGLRMAEGLDAIVCELCGRAFGHSREALAHLGGAHPEPEA